MEQMQPVCASHCRSLAFQHGKRVFAVLSGMVIACVHGILFVNSRHFPGRRVLAEAENSSVNGSDWARFAIKFFQVLSTLQRWERCVIRSRGQRRE